MVENTPFVSTTFSNHQFLREAPDLSVMCEPPTTVTPPFLRASHLSLEICNNNPLRVLDDSKGLFFTEAF